MTSTTPLFQLPPGFFQHIIDQGKEQATSILTVLWPQIWVVILIVAMLTIFDRLIHGRIGSAIYNIVYFGIFFSIVAIWGVRIFFNPFFDVLSPVSYFVAGLILKKIKN